MVLAWLLDRVQEDLAVEVKFKMYSLPVLLYELVREENKSTNTSLSLYSSSGCDTRVPTISIAEVHFDRDLCCENGGLQGVDEKTKKFICRMCVAWFPRKDNHPLKLWPVQGEEEK